MSVSASSPKGRSIGRPARPGRGPDGTVELAARAGSRPVIGVLCGLAAIVLLLQQIALDGAQPLLRAGLVSAALVLGVLAPWMVRRGLRRGPAVRVGPAGVGIALGFSGWVEVPWSEVRAWRFWHPSGMARLASPGAPCWLGLWLRDPGLLARPSWDQRVEMLLDRLNNRPPLCVVDRYLAGSIIEVLEAFQTQAPELCSPENPDPRGGVDGARDPV